MEKQATEIADKVEHQVEAIPNAQQIRGDIERLVAAVDQEYSRDSKADAS